MTFPKYIDVIVFLFPCRETVKDMFHHAFNSYMVCPVNFVC